MTPFFMLFLLLLFWNFHYVTSPRDFVNTQEPNIT